MDYQAFPAKGQQPTATAQRPWGISSKAQQHEPKLINAPVSEEDIVSLMLQLDHNSKKKKMTSEQSHFELTAVLENSDIGKRKISPFHLNYHLKKKHIQQKTIRAGKNP